MVAWGGRLTVKNGFWPPSDGWAWTGFMLIIAIACFGAFLTYIAMRGSEELVEKVSGGISDGGEWIGLFFIVAVALLAVPITFLWGLFSPPPE